MRYTSTALYYNKASKNSLHKPRATLGNMLFQINSGFNYHLQIVCLHFLFKTRLNFKNLTFDIKVELLIL